MSLSTKRIFISSFHDSKFNLIYTEINHYNSLEKMIAYYKKSFLLLFGIFWWRIECCLSRLVNRGWIFSAAYSVEHFKIVSIFMVAKDVF